MIPIHLVSQIANSAITGRPLRGEHPKAGRKSGRRGCGNVDVNSVGGRLILAGVFSLLLAGGLISINWGGTGIFFREPEASVSPGINAQWMNAGVPALIGRLETDSRELYRERPAVANLLELKAGDDVADVGAGTGFLSEEIAGRVGPSGRVYAVELNPLLVEHIQQQAQAKGLSSLRAHLGEERKLNISRRDGGNFDLIVVADTYQVLEFPKSMLYSMRRLLRNRGRLVIIEPLPGTDASLGRTRLAEDALIHEVTQEGFVLVNKMPAPFLPNHYVLRFSKD